MIPYAIFLILKDFGVHGSVVVNVLDCQSRGSRFKSRAEIWFEIYVPPAPPANSAMMSTLTGHCQWEDKTARERTGHPPSCA